VNEAVVGVEDEVRVLSQLGNASAWSQQSLNGGNQQELYQLMAVGRNVQGSIDIDDDTCFPRFQRCIAAWFGHHASTPTRVVDALVTVTNVLTDDVPDEVMVSSAETFVTAKDSMSLKSGASVCSESKGVTSQVDRNSRVATPFSQRNRAGRKAQVTVTTQEPLQGNAFTRAVVNAVLPSSEPLIDGAVKAIIDGDMVVETIVDSSGVTQPVSSGSDQCVKIQPRGKRRRKPIRIPVLAGEVSAMLRLRHGYLHKNAENSMLVRQDASRRVQALRKDKDPLFVNLRDSDLLLVVEYSSRMYWIPSSDELDMISVMDNNPILQQRSNQWSKFTGSTSCGN